MVNRAVSSGYAYFRVEGKSSVWLCETQNCVVWGTGPELVASQARLKINHLAMAQWHMPSILARVFAGSPEIFRSQV